MCILLWKTFNLFVLCLPKLVLRLLKLLSIFLFEKKELIRGNRRACPSCRGGGAGGVDGTSRVRYLLETFLFLSNIILKFPIGIIIDSSKVLHIASQRKISSTYCSLLLIAIYFFVLLCLFRFGVLWA